MDSVDHPVQSLNGNWSLRFDPGNAGLAQGWAGGWDDSLGEAMTVPSTYNAPGGPHRGHQGIAWFARRFPGELARGGRVRLCFQGVLLRCKVWLNGVALGEREGGFTPFYFEVGKRLRPGENLLVVRADNRLTYFSLPPRVRPRHNPVWGVYGGIYRDAYLEALPAAYLAKVRALPYQEGTREGTETGFDLGLLIHGDARPCSLTVELADPAGRVAAARGFAVPAGKMEAGKAGAYRVLAIRWPIPFPREWAPGRPDLYVYRFRLRGPGGSESVSLKVGYRLIAADGEALRLNGRRLFLKGISKMEDDPERGQTQDTALIRRDLSLIRDMRANYIRLAHYPHHPAEGRMARDMGLMLGEEIPFFHVGEGWSQWLVDFQGPSGFPFSSFGLKQLHRRDLLADAQRSLLELIERDGSNPAVILWSLGNESYSLGDGAGRMYAWMREAARLFDPTRPVTMAEMTYYWPWLDARRTTAAYLDVASLNMYYGWYFGEASGAAANLDRFHARYPGHPVVLSEFGAEAALGRGDSAGLRTGDRVFFPRTYSEAYQADLLREHVAAAWARPWVAGVSPWCFADFYCPWFPHNPVPEYNTKGVLTRERVPKLGYAALREAYGALPDYRPEAEPPRQQTVSAAGR
jgi:beta-glucuronidase